MAIILNLRFIDAITYHNFLHRLWESHGMGNATLEINMLQQVAALREEVLHTIFLDLNKDYNALDRYSCMGILEGYGMGPRALHLFRLYWVRLRMLARTGGYYGATFYGERGVTQGDPLSTTI